MKNKVLMLCAAIACGVATAFAETCTVDGVTYRYSVKDGEAKLGCGYVYVAGVTTRPFIPAIPASTTGAITIPSSLDGYPVTSIEGTAFMWCDGLTSVTIPDSVTTVGNEAFFRCTYLDSVTIPDGVTSIGGCAFYACENLTSMVIPASVRHVGSDAFEECTNWLVA